MNLKEETLIEMEEFINNFCTKSDIKKYKSNKLQDKYIKTKVLNKAKTICDIEFVGDGKFFIKSIYKNKKPLFLVEHENDLYYNISYSILNQLKTKYHTESTPLIKGKLGYSKNIDIINENYYKIKYNNEKASEMLNIKIDNIKDFIDVTMTSINYYIKNTLDMLEKQGLLIYYDDILMVIEHNKNFNFYDKTYEEIHREATNEEMRNFLDIKYALMSELNIETEKDLYFGKSRMIFKNEFSKRLKDIGICGYYYAYKIFYTTIKKVDSFLKWYDKSKIDYTSAMNSLFIELTNRNAKRRNDEEIYIKDYKTLSELMLNTIEYEFLDLNTDVFEADVISYNNKIEVKVKRRN